MFSYRVESMETTLDHATGMANRNAATTEHEAGNQTADNEGKISRDPVTGYPTIQIMGRTVVLQKDVGPDFMEKPAEEVIECAL